MTIADDARRKAGSQRWSPTGNASLWPIIAARRYRLPSQSRLEQLCTGRGRLHQCIVTGSLHATTVVEAGAKLQSP
jgi:hypothetical protein